MTAGKLKTDVSASNTLYARGPGNTVALVGTSITNNLGSMNSYQFSECYWGWANVMLGHRFDLISIDGVPGSGSTDGGFAARIAAVAAGPAQWVCVEALTNDIAGGQTFTAIKTAITATLTTLKAAGKRVMLLTAPPRNGLTGAQRLVWGQVNHWIRQVIALIPGIFVIDVASYLTDPANSTPASYVSAFQSDGIHPTSIGGKQMGYAFLAALDAYVPKGNLLGPQSDSNNMIAYAKSSWAGGASAYPTSWSGAAAGATFSQIARTDGIQGIVQRCVVPAGGNLDLHTPVGGYSVGDRLVGYLEVMGISGIESSPAAGTQVCYVYIQAFTAAYGNANMTSELYPQGGYIVNVPPYTGYQVFQTPPMTVPANGMQETDFFIAFYGGATYDLGRVGVVKVDSSY